MDITREPFYAAPLAKFCQGVTTQEKAHKLALRKMRRRIKQISLILKNRGWSYWMEDEDELDEFTIELLEWRENLMNAVNCLKNDWVPFYEEDDPIPAPSEFTDAEDAKSYFNNRADDYNWWLANLVGNP